MSSSFRWCLRLILSINNDVVFIRKKFSSGLRLILITYYPSSTFDHSYEASCWHQIIAKNLIANNLEMLCVFICSIATIFIYLNGIYGRLLIETPEADVKN